VDETGKPVGHSVVFEAPLAFLSVIAAVLDRDGDEGGKFALRVFGYRQVIQSVADEGELSGAVMDDEDGSFSPVLVSGGNVNVNLAGLVDGFLLGLEGGVVALEDFAVRKGHGEFE